jgi:hypothetical protein
MIELTCGTLVCRCQRDRPSGRTGWRREIDWRGEGGLWGRVADEREKGRDLKGAGKGKGAYDTHVCVTCRISE